MKHIRQIAVLCGAAALGVVAMPGTSAACSWFGSSGWSCSGSASNYNAQPGAPVAGAVQRSGTTTQVSAIANHLGGAFSASGARRVASLGETGIAGGDASSRYSLWVNGSGGRVSSTSPANDFSGNNKGGAVGMDYAPSDNLLVGVALMGEHISLNTKFNLGSLNRVGYSVVPYVAYSFGQGTSIDVITSATFLDADVVRAQNGRGSYDGYRLMGAFNVHHGVELGAWSVRGDIGYMYSREWQGSYREEVSNAHIGAVASNLGQGKIGGRGGYLLDKVELFAQAHYVRDFVAKRTSTVQGQPNTPDDRDEVLAGIGMDWFPTQTESIGLEISHGFFREAEANTTMMMNAKIKF
ncbi:outer membrane protein domain-containing protein [Paramagnetospirillum caucaseum]|uniref:Outer membrane protein domain-containing protein n=1 Tax=Paramagnetospirillum caucaseum TaxID=1244869 RepID=M3A9L0_9PROT|nr:autotransporter outer membrane beta-barrel domain-containing protein [Paramagnetospirillum caucaseum]EME69468.1 outer membrane protein domain-containing protein [Paramagnetospirillum caucaseum]